MTIRATFIPILGFYPGRATRTEATGLLRRILQGGRRRGNLLNFFRVGGYRLAAGGSRSVAYQVLDACRRLPPPVPPGLPLALLPVRGSHQFHLSPSGTRTKPVTMQGQLLRNAMPKARHVPKLCLYLGTCDAARKMRSAAAGGKIFLPRSESRAVRQDTPTYPRDSPPPKSP